MYYLAIASHSAHIYIFPCLDPQIYRQSQPFIYAGSTNHRSRIFEKQIPESSKKQNLNLLHAGNYLNSIYIVLITSHRASQVALVVKNSPANQSRMFSPWVGKIPWRRAWQPAPVVQPGESHGQRSLAGYSSQGCTESDTTEAT